MAQPSPATQEANPVLKPVDHQPQGQPLGPRPAGEPAGTPGPTGARFEGQLQATRARATQSSMVGLLAEIDEQGRRLEAHPVAGEVARYRDLVGRFLREAVDQFSQTDRQMDHRNRVFTLVKEVDRQLADLTESVLAGQGKPLGLLGKLEQIRGMLVDLLI
ncbi:MAG: YaaR family protein [Candidatus Sericytochromatia bacterium]|nr:YaaR family protein [Candidatus Sericytochromatia bacterium]